MTNAEYNIRTWLTIAAGLSTALIALNLSKHGATYGALFFGGVAALAMLHAAALKRRHDKEKRQ